MFEMAEFVRDLQNILAIREIQVPLIRRRNYRNRTNPFEEYNECEFRERYRFTKDAVRFVINLVEDDLTPTVHHQYDVSPSLQVLIALPYFAKGCYQLEIGDLHGVSQSTASRVIAKASRVLASKRVQFVKWPLDLQGAREAFFEKARLPCVVGCIDCTHIRIKNPHGDQPLLYCNRKGFYSLNVQIVCDASTRITDIVARWGGSAHDSRIWTNSTIRDQFENNQRTGIILGDSGYPCSQYMLTPLLHPQTPAEERYNRAHKSTRVTVECCFGRWKSMFRALQNNMQISLETAKAAIVAMAILYNIKCDFDDDFQYEEVQNDNEAAVVDQLPRHAPPVLRGNLFRQRFIQEHF